MNNDNGINQNDPNNSIQSNGSLPEIKSILLNPNNRQCVSTLGNSGDSYTLLDDGDLDVKYNDNNKYIHETRTSKRVRFRNRVSYIESIQEAYPKTFTLFEYIIILMVLLSYIVINLRLGMYVFCEVDATSGRYVVVEDENNNTCPMTFIDDVDGNVDKNERSQSLKNQKLIMCLGSYRMLSFISDVSSFKTMLLPPVMYLNESKTCSSDTSLLTQQENETTEIILFQNIKKAFSDVLMGSHASLSLYHTKQEQIDSTTPLEKNKASPPIQKDENVSENQQLSSDWTQDVSSPLHLDLSDMQISLVRQLNMNFKSEVHRQLQTTTTNSIIDTKGTNKDAIITTLFQQRMEAIAWGGPIDDSNRPTKFAWWHPHPNEPKSTKHTTNHHHVEGIRLITSYMKIMKWPQNLISHFPATPCGANGCNAEFALTHTLKFRESYKPWLLTPTAYRENENGWMYVRGYSPTRYHSDASIGGYSLLWYRPGKKKMNNEEGYIRIIVHSIDACVADVLKRSDGMIGKCNVVIDCEGFSLSMLPPMKSVKKILKMTQDHFPDRLGVLVLANMSNVSQMFMKLVNPFIPDIVKRKIHILPNNDKLRYDMVKELVDERYIPSWLGGSDSFKFDSKGYYKSGSFQTNFFADEEGEEYKIKMPYHA